MNIGIDVSSLQGPHRMRGIGYTTANFLHNLENSSSNKYCLYVYPNDDQSIQFITSLLSIPENKYEFRIKHHSSVGRAHTNKWLRLFSKLISKSYVFLTYRYGVSRYTEVKDIDAFIQFDQSEQLPRLQRSAKKYLIAYDLIPYVLETDYLWGYKTSRQHGRRKRSAIKSMVKRYAYLKKVSLNARNADHVFAISQTTRQDFVRYANVNEKKISTIYLGVDHAVSKTGSSPLTVQRYVVTSWGSLPFSITLKPKSFLLFVGGADNRRKLDDLVAAFNQLKVEHSELKLVLSGDTMTGPLSIPSEKIQKALLSSSYKDDIYFLGFTDENTKNWLYGNAIAFVFPSLYEGFGLPILEAMLLKAPVVAYENRAVKEIGGNTPFYASDIVSLTTQIQKVMTMSKDKTVKLIQQGIQHTKKFDWKKTTHDIIATVEKNGK